MRMAVAVLHTTPLGLDQFSALMASLTGSSEPLGAEQPMRRSGSRTTRERMCRMWQ